MMSPSANGLSSGMPWQATLFTDVQTDFGNIEYRSGDGYAFDSIVSLCTNSSISSVVNPGCVQRKIKPRCVSDSTSESEKNVYFYLENSRAFFQNIGGQSTALTHCRYGASHFNFGFR